MQTEVAQKHFRENRPDTLSLWRTIGFIRGLWTFAPFVCVEPGRLQSIPAVPRLARPSGQLRTGTAALPSSLLAQVPHVLPKPRFIPAPAVST